MRRSIPALTLMVLMMALTPRPANAAGAGYQIAGTPMSCTDFRGRSVMALEVYNLGDVGRAWVINTVPYILMDPEVMRTLPKPLQVFFYVHECAHHALGHWYSPTPNSENDADCWAVAYGRDHGIFLRQTIVDFEPWLARSKGSAFGHLPGHQRVQHMLDCFDDRLQTAQQ